MHSSEHPITAGVLSTEIIERHCTAATITTSTTIIIIIYITITLVTTITAAATITPLLFYFHTILGVSCP
jgi:hypothetical protein